MLKRVDWIPLCIGVLIVVFRAHFARSAVQGQKRLWGWEVSERQTRALALVVGAGFIVVGLVPVLAGLGP